MKKIILIRHGQQLRGMDEGLTDLGKQQAQKTAQHFAAYLAQQGNIAGILPVISNEHKKQAEAISELTGLPLTIDSKLRERMNWGDVNPDEPFEEFSRLWKETLANRDVKPHGRNSARESGELLDTFIQALPDNKTRYVIVAHGGLFAELLRNKFTMEELGEKMSHFPQILEKGWKGFSHCSLSELTIDDEGNYHINELNNTNHLEGGIGEGIISGGHTETGNISSQEDKG